MADTILARTGHSLALYRRLAGARIRSDFQYRTAFAMRIVGQIGITALDIAAIFFLFQKVPTLAGWSLGEVAFLYGINSVCFALADITVGSLDGLNEEIRIGTLDQILTRPVSPVVFLAGDKFALRRVGQLLQSAVVLVVAVVLVDHAWSLADAVLLVLALASGTVIFICVFVMSGAAIFWLLEGREVMNSVIYGGRFLSEYPLGVYSGWLRRAVIFVVPIGFAAYLPAVTILGKSDPLPNWAGWLSPLVAVVFASIAGGLWSFAIRNYRSTGS